jgi:hypothetical protein
VLCKQAFNRLTRQQNELLCACSQICHIILWHNIITIIVVANYCKFNGK